MDKPGDIIAKRMTEAIHKAYITNLENQFEDFACDLIVTAVETRSFQAFTGNTLTSYGCGVYVYGQLVFMVFSNETLRSPLRIKVQKGEMVCLDNPYEGVPRGVVGGFETTKEYGFETSKRIIQEWNAPSNKPISLIMTTGTEYSTFLENELGFDVLTNTFDSAREILLNNIKPII